MKKMIVSNLRQMLKIVCKNMWLNINKHFQDFLHFNPAFYELLIELVVQYNFSTNGIRV